MYVPFLIGEGKYRGKKEVRKREGGGREGETESGNKRWRKRDGEEVKLFLCLHWR